MTTTILGNVVAVVICVLSLPARAQELSASLSLATDPDKAMVTCDGILRDVTPLTLDGLRPGLHLVGIEKTGFLPVRRTVILVGGQRASLSIPL
ncbi:MAG: PEGA domain-containing protein, partial [bacterium]